MNNSERATIHDRQTFKLFKTISSIKLPAIINEKKNPTLFGHIALSTGLLLSFALADVAISKLGEQKQKKWLSVPDPRAEITLGNNSFYYYDPNKVIDSLLASVQLTAQEREVLRLYYLYTAARAFVHSDVFSYCYLRSFVTVKIIAAASLISTLCLFFISRVGWERANNAVINIFIMASTIIVFYGSIFVGLNYEKNAKTNRQLYTAYSNLGHETLRFLSTQRSRDGQPMTPADFITYLDLKLEELGEITLEFNTNEVLRSKEEVYQILKPNAPDETPLDNSIAP